MKINASHPMAKLARSVFPDYTGRKFFAESVPSVEFYDLNWSGGTKRSYVIVRVSDGQIAQGMDRAHPAHNVMEGKTVPMTPEYVIVCRSWFCGREGGLTVYTYSHAQIASENPAGWQLIEA